MQPWLSPPNASERTGWKNYYLYDLSGQLLAPLTNHEFEVANIIRVDEDAGLLYYLARSGDNQSAVLNTAFSSPLQVTVTANDPGVPVAGGVVPGCVVGWAPGTAGSVGGTPPPGGVN